MSAAPATDYGGGGWEAKPGKFEVTDKSGANNGIQKIKLQDRSATAPNQIRCPSSPVASATLRL